MKGSATLLMFLIFIQIRSVAQDFRFFVDKTKYSAEFILNNQFFVDKQEDGYIFFNHYRPTSYILDPMKYVLQKIDLSGTVIREFYFDGGGNYYINKANHNYLLSKYVFEPGKRQLNVTLLGPDFEELENNTIFSVDTIIEDEADIFYYPPKLLKTNSENVLFFPFPISADLTYLLKLKFDKDGYYLNEWKNQIENKPLSFTQPFEFENHYILYSSSGIMYFDKDLTEVKRVPLADAKIPNTWMSGIAFTSTDSTIFTTGTTLEVAPHRATPFVARLKEDMVFNPEDTLNLKFVHTNPYFRPAQYVYNTADECFGIEEDGTFTSILGYSYPGNIIKYEDGSTTDTLSGRIIVAKFNKELDLLCQNNVYFENHVINIYRGTYLGSGEYLVTGSIDSIELENLNRTREFHPFFGIIKANCSVPWAKGTLSTINHSPDINEINLFPNPVTNILKAAVKKDQEAVVLSVFDMNGRKIYTGKGSDLIKGLDVSTWKPGPYFLILGGHQKKIIKL